MRTRGKLLHIQTPALDCSAIWTKPCRCLNNQLYENRTCASHQYLFYQNMMHTYSYHHTTEQKWKSENGDVWLRNQRNASGPSEPVIQGPPNPRRFSRKRRIIFSFKRNWNYFCPYILSKLPTALHTNDELRGEIWSRSDSQAGLYIFISQETIESYLMFL